MRLFLVAGSPPLLAPAANDFLVRLMSKNYQSKLANLFQEISPERKLSTTKLSTGMDAGFPGTNVRFRRRWGPPQASRSNAGGRALHR
jgi:hypothetical protein